MSFFNFALGVIVGFFLAILIFAGISAFDIRLDLNILINIFIAWATVIATLIHYDSQKKQRTDRIWNINKDILLDLTHMLSESIEATVIEIDNLHGYADERTSSKKHDWRKLDEKINYVLNVYSPLMEKDLLASLNHHKEIGNVITRRFENDDLDVLDAYQQMLNEHTDLYKKLQSFIGKISGINALQL